MPIYEYECRACGEENEIIQKMSAGALRKCPSCGALKLRRKISRSAFHLKGEGWYATDYANNGKKAEEKKADQESPSKSESSKSEPKGESKKTEKAPAGKEKSDSKKAAGVKSSS